MQNPSLRRCLAAALVFVGGARVAPPAYALDPASPYGVCAGPCSPTLWNAVSDAGIAWTRSDFSWRMVEGAGKGQFDWSTTDSEVAETNARGINIVGDFSYSPAWASGNGDQRNPPANPQDWYDYVFATVSRYKASVHHWELWNEPNLSQFFSGSLQQYIDVIFKVGADAVHAADPTAKVVGPELFGGTGSSNPAWMRAVLQQAGAKLDIVSFHQYGGGDVPSGRLSAIDTMHNLVVSEGYGDRDIWITECGWHDAQLGGNLQLQGQYLVDMLNGMAARSAWFKKFFWYQIWEGLPPDDLWGLCRQDETRKPVWFAYRDYIAASPWAPGAAGAPDDAQVVSDTIPTSMVAGNGYAVTITMKNIGTAAWQGNQVYNLGAVGDSDPFAVARQFLDTGESVAPGASKTFSFTMTAPTGAGTYTTDWQMVHELVRWFGGTLTKQVTVTAPPVTTGGTTTGGATTGGTTTGGATTGGATTGGTATGGTATGGTATGGTTTGGTTTGGAATGAAAPAASSGGGGGGGCFAGSVAACLPHAQWIGILWLALAAAALRRR